MNRFALLLAVLLLTACGDDSADCLELPEGTRITDLSGEDVCLPQLAEMEGVCTSDTLLEMGGRVVDVSCGDSVRTTLVVWADGEAHSMAGCQPHDLAEEQDHCDGVIRPWGWVPGRDVPQF